MINQLKVYIAMFLLIGLVVGSALALRAYSKAQQASGVAAVEQKELEVDHAVEKDSLSDLVRDNNSKLDCKSGK